MHRYRRTLLAIAAAVALNPSGMAGQPKGEKVTLTGELVDMWCFMEAGDRGPAKKACATTCAKAGNPIALLDAKGTLYLTAGLESHQPARDLLIEKMNEQVTLTGTLVKKNGVQMLYVDTTK